MELCSYSISHTNDKAYEFPHTEFNWAAAQVYRQQLKFKAFLTTNPHFYVTREQRHL